MAHRWEASPPEEPARPAIAHSLLELSQCVRRERLKRERERRGSDFAGRRLSSCRLGIGKGKPLHVCQKRQGGQLADWLRKKVGHVDLGGARPVRLEGERRHRSHSLAEGFSAGRMEHALAHVGGIGNPACKGPAKLGKPQQEEARCRNVEERRDRLCQLLCLGGTRQRRHERKRFVDDPDLQPPHRVSSALARVLKRPAQPGR
eukprot:scaffold5161_cov125-Isochrysis_galbana.AAC.3